MHAGGMVGLMLSGSVRHITTARANVTFPCHQGVCLSSQSCLSEQQCDMIKRKS